MLTSAILAYVFGAFCLIAAIALSRALTHTREECKRLYRELNSAIQGRAVKPTPEQEPQKFRKYLTSQQTLRAADLLDAIDKADTHLANAVLWEFLTSCVPEAAEDDARLISDNPARYAIEWPARPIEVDPA